MVRRERKNHLIVPTVATQVSPRLFYTNSPRTLVSSGEVKQKAKETLKSATELLKAVKESVHTELETTAPKVVNTLDRSFDKASSGLSDTLRVIDRKTGKEQIELLKAYGSFLQKQSEMIQSRISDLERDHPKDEPK